MVMGIKAEKLLSRMARGFALTILAVASVASLSAQDTVEARLAAMEARIQQLESELAAARGVATVSVSASVSDQGNLKGAFIRPAVLTTSSPVEMASAAAPPAPMAAAQATTPDFSGEFEGLNFFKGVKFAGFLDTYYTWDTNEPTSGKVTWNNFNFNHNSLTLSQADLDVTKAVSDSSPLGYMLQMDFGPTADFVNSGDPAQGNSTARHFMQYYMSAKLGKATIDFGKFVTQHGAEVIDTRGDWNYSRGLLFAWAIPYYHFGARVTMPVSSKFTAAAYLVNGWNNVVDNNKGKTLGLQGILTSGPVSFVQNYMVGQEQANASDVRHLFDSLLTVKLGSMATFMTNYDYGMDRSAGAHVHWQGIAAYLKLQPTPKFALTPRFEYFDDRMGFMTGTAQILKEFTLTPEFTISNNLVTRFEYRHDWGNRPTFEVSDPSDDPHKQNTIGVGMILKF
jgi:putative OmpL-like beta-barrel porin-2